MDEKIYTVDDALNLIKELKFQEAKELLLKIEQNEENQIEILKNLALCELNLNNPQQALLLFQDLVKKDENNALAYFYIGTIYALINNDVPAENAFMKVIELRPYYAEAYKNLIAIWLKNGQLNKIKEIEDKLDGLESSDYKLFYMLGTAYMALNEFDNAIKYLLKAYGNNPENDVLINSIGSLYMASENPQEALNFFRKSLDLNPENSLSYYNIAIAYKLLKQPEKAYEYFEKAYKLEPSPFYLTSLATAALKAEHYDEAVKYYEIIASSGEKESYNFYLACAYAGAKDYDKALELLLPKEDFDISTVSVLYKLKLIEIYTVLQRYEDAKKIYNEIISKGGATPEIYYDYALVCVKSGEKDKAEIILKKVIQLNPDFAAAHKDLGVLYLDARLFDYAKDEFHKAYELEPENPFIVYEYGNFYQLTGEYGKAEEFYDKVLTMDFLTPDILLNIALNNLSKNNTEKAQEILERARKLDTQNVRILYNLGKLYFLNNKKDTAKQILEDAYFLEQNHEVENMLGQIYFEEEDFDCAYSMFKRIDEKYPQNTANLMYLAKCSLKLGEKEKAAEYLHRYTEIFPEDPDAIAMLADLI